MSTTLRRSSRAIKQVNYIGIDLDSSGKEDAYTKPIIVSDDSSEDVRPSEPALKRTRPSNSKATKSTRRTNKASNPALKAPDISGPVERLHAVSRHDPNRLLPCIPALLTWFEKQRDVRGMPWRKMYDPNLTKKERGQRAYEVLVSEVRA